MSKSKIKSIESTTRRIIAKVEAGNYDYAQIEHMIQSLIKNRDKVITNLKKNVKPRELVLSEGSIAGAIRDCINSHGDITKCTIGSAAKRILGNCTRMVNEKKPVTNFVLHDVCMRGMMPKHLTEEFAKAIFHTDGIK